MPTVGARPKRSRVRRGLRRHRAALLASVGEHVPTAAESSGSGRGAPPAVLAGSRRRPRGGEGVQRNGHGYLGRPTGREGDGVPPSVPFGHREIEGVVRRAGRRAGLRHRRTGRENILRGPTRALRQRRTEAGGGGGGHGSHRRRHKQVHPRGRGERGKREILAVEWQGSEPEEEEARRPGVEGQRGGGVVRVAREAVGDVREDAVRGAGDRVGRRAGHTEQQREVPEHDPGGVTMYVVGVGGNVERKLDFHLAMAMDGISAQ
mmetsp:Transcript_43740/g.92992  ORF Transcript_43740/g.92992 Transcript_43740/m.92992 type:complete len:263 (-) Transcript_43740:203-991(-)